MLDTTKWFDRKFDFSFGAGKYAAIYDRLKQAPVTLQQLVVHIPEGLLINKPGGKWSAKEHTGHLSVLEPVWRVRFGDILENKPVLTPADLNNKATTEALFNNYAIASLVEKFVAERNETLSFLNSIQVLDDSQTSLHPRLQQPMRIIDLAYFVAEHDDHHISVIRELITPGAGN